MGEGWNPSDRVGWLTGGSSLGETICYARKPAKVEQTMASRQFGNLICHISKILLLRSRVIGQASLGRAKRACCYDAY